MTDTAEERVGTFRQRSYFVLVRATPDFDTPDEFAAVLYYESDSSETTQIARIDTAHGYTHFDRLYKRGEPKDAVEMDLWEAWTHLKSDWRTYAESYDSMIRIESKMTVILSSVSR
ncbi:MAG: hypothetical protein IH933_09855 [Euryarchaeota archaeon]|nr:hypothetical protein [Euryarchaeota archaeon]